MRYVLGKGRCSRAKVKTGRTIHGPGERMSCGASGGGTGKRWKSWRDILKVEMVGCAHQEDVWRERPTTMFRSQIYS